jgi:hypothetical protein
MHVKFVLDDEWKLTSSIQCSKLHKAQVEGAKGGRVSDNPKLPRKVKKTQHHQNPEFGHTQDEIQRKPASKTKQFVFGKKGQVHIS